MQVFPLQIFGNVVVEPVFAVLWRELLYQRQALGVGDVGADLAAKGAMADGLEPCLECLKNLLLIEIGKLLAKALQITEGVFVDEAN